MNCSGLWLVLLLAQTQVKASRSPTAKEVEANELRPWEGAVKNIAPFDAGQPNPPFHWKLSNILREVPIEGTQRVNDVPVKLHSVVVKGGIGDVMEELYAHFLRSGLYMDPPNKQDQFFRQLQLTALDTDRAISYTAWVDGQADGTCIVVLGEANIGESTRVGLLRKASSVPEASDFAPLMPMAISPSRVNLEGMRTLTFTILASSEGLVRKFYQEQLKKLGYTEAQKDLFQRGKEEIQLSMHRDSEQLNVLLSLRPKLDD